MAEGPGTACRGATGAGSPNYDISITDMPLALCKKCEKKGVFFENTCILKVSSSKIHEAYDKRTPSFVFSVISCLVWFDSLHQSKGES